MVGAVVPVSGEAVVKSVVGAVVAGGGAAAVKSVVDAALHTQSTGKSQGMQELSPC